MADSLSLIGTNPRCLGVVDEGSRLVWLEAQPVTTKCGTTRDVPSRALQRDYSATHDPLLGAAHFRVKRHVVSGVAGTAANRENTMRIIRQSLPCSSHSHEKLLVVVNPRSGHGNGRRIYETRMKPLLQAAGIGLAECFTTRSGQPAEMGASYLLGNATGESYFGALVIGGDGTVNQFINGFMNTVLDRARRSYSGDVAALQASIERDLSSLRLSTVACGTQNALAVGLRTKYPEYACWCIIQNRTRLVDAFDVSNGNNEKLFGVCGVGWGVAGAIAADSERFRGMGTSRYMWLKLRHGAAAAFGVQRYRARVVWGRRANVLSSADPTAKQPFGAMSPDTVSVSSAGIVPSVSSDSLLEVTSKTATPSPATSPVSVVVTSPPAAPRLVTCGTNCSVCVSKSARGARAALSYLCTRVATDHITPASATSTGLSATPPVESSSVPLLSPSTRAAPAAATPRSSDADGEDRSEYVTVGIVNTSPDARFGHAADGQLDLILARKGGPIDTAGLLARYVGRFMRMSDERNSVLYDYIQTDTIRIEPEDDAMAFGCNVDGEVLAGPGPFTVTSIPGLFRVYGQL